ncbi:HYR domain-containing protein [Winogradskyella sp. A3E31]|uniref:HYR domain-containing protein n=1 Tax=Winogradskyella sp. A3E31 TaxID=3349637 RepID=UPI00398AF961
MNGNTATCNATVTVEDNIPPVLTPGADRNVNLNASCQIIIPNVRGTATDNCSVTIIQSPAQGTSVAATHNSPVTVTVTATDASGNTDVETVILTPRDVTLPTISCPSNITVTNDNGVCGANVTYAAPTFNDNCSGASISQTAGLASGSTFPVGTTTNTFVVTDFAGNTRSCSFTVTVTDNEDPVLTPAPNQNVNLNASCQVLIPDVRGTATDNCTNPVTITQSPAQNLAIAATHNNPITVTVTATDASGNTDVETVIITPMDVTPPSITCPGNQSVNFDAGCEFILADYTGLASASDNCDTNITITQSPAIGTTLSGATTVTLTATDNAGLSSSCTFQVIPNDLTPPNAVCQDITVSLGATGSVNILPTDIDNGSSDTCGPVFFSISDSNFTCADIGPNTVTLTVSDNSGNMSTCTATVNVVDDTAPTMQCNDFVVVIDPLTQEATINASDIDNGSNDACGLASLTVSPNTFNTSQLGNNTVTLTATDVNGNSNTCTAVVTVEPPINEDTILTGTIVDPLEPGESPLPPSALIEATACPGGITAPRDISLNLQASDPNTYNLQASQVIEWQYSQDNGETWTVLPSSSGTLSYTLLDITDDTFVRVRVYDANDPTLEQFSSQVFIRFLPPDEPPILTSDPRFDICLGESVLLTAESFFDQPNGQFGEGGEFNYAQPDGWRVDYLDGFFPASGDNGNETTWKETNSNNNALFSNINYDTADNTKFALAHGVGNVTQLETPVFSTIGMTSAEAIMTFDTSFFFCNGGYGTIWLSFDSGATYAPANELTAYWESDDTPINFTTGNDTGIHVTKQGNCNSANSQRASTDPRMTAAYINLGPYVGLSGLRVRFEFFGSTSTCTNVSFPPAPGNNCNPVRTFDVASGWAIDNVGFAYAGVDDELEWTDEQGNVIAIGSQATVQPITPGIRNYGVTNLVNGCRAPGDDGTNDDTLVYTSLAYAGQDYIPAGNQCGENFVQLHAYDNTIKSRANFDLGNWETGLYAVPADDASDYDPTGVGGQWTIVNSATTSCGNLATFSSNTDPNATFNASPGTYTLRWTLDDGSGCSDDVVVTVVDCPTIDFDGINDHIDFRNNYNFDSTYGGSGDFSIEVWVKPNSVNGTKTVFSRKDDDDNTTGYALTVVDGQVRFNWYKSAGSGSITSGGLSIGTDRWYHLAITFDGSQYVMYVDGILINTQNGAAPDATPNNIKAMLGATDQAPPNEATKYFHGWMDELRIWTRVLDVQHIRQMMNQEINASGADVMGAVIPTKIYGPDINNDGVEDDPLLWSELEGYYRMNVACGDFSPYKGVAGRLRNIQTSQQETAPLPYTSRANSSWDTDNTWTHHTVWDVPNSDGIDGTPIDWNIVRTTHNITTNTRNLTVLGLLVDQNKLTVTDLGDADQDENNNGVGIWVTDYLKLNGEIDLVGESQLVQKRISTRQFNESILDVTSAGNLERDQQGTTNLFNYNYFSSPVGAINTTANNVPENLVNLLLDGSNTNLNPHPVIQWTNSYNATPGTTPITLSNRWIFQYENYPWDTYAAWNYKGNTGTLDPGFGFTMKGSGQGNANEGGEITGGSQGNGLQNYVFKGKPNNEDILIPITSGYQALIGNPYPSAIDANEFIDDNVPGGNPGSGASTEGTLYFWEHYLSNQTHILEEYEGGYAVLNKTGGVAVYLPALISGAGTASKTPERYVPVGQGFFVGNVQASSGNVKFENDQRVFVRENVSGTNSGSVFFRNNQKDKDTRASTNNNTQGRTISSVDGEEDAVISRIRLNFTSHVDGKIRPLLLGFTSDNSATDGFDYGYDASNTYFQNNDAFFIIEDGVYVIQGVGEFNEDKMYPLGIFLSENSDVEVALTDIESFEEDIDVFIYDAVLDIYTKLNDTNFETNLEPDYYADRFFITFKASSTLSDDEIVKDDLVYVAYLDASKDIYIKIPNKVAKKVNLINVLGQTVRTWDSGLEEYYSNAYRIPVSGLPSGTYILKVETDSSTLSKKIIIN